MDLGALRVLWDVGSSFIELGCHDNMGIDVGISSLSSLRADIWLFLVAISGLAAAKPEIATRNVGFPTSGYVKRCRQKFH